MTNKQSTKHDEINDEQLYRYSRQMILEDIGEKGQLKLLNSKVLVVGAGGLASPVLLYLAGAGIGNIGIVEFDTVEESNLQRQIIHNQDDISLPKVMSAKEKINNLNNDVKVDIYQTRIDDDNAKEIFSKYDYIIDCSDNFQTKYLMNKTVCKLGKILITGAVNRYEGQVMLINKNSNNSNNSPCYNCVTPQTPDLEKISRCDSIGVLGSTVGIVGSIMATEVLKSILKIGIGLDSKILLIDTLDNIYKLIDIKKDATCKVCNLYNI